MKDNKWTNLWLFAIALTLITQLPRIAMTLEKIAIIQSPSPNDVTTEKP